MGTGAISAYTIKHLLYTVLVQYMLILYRGGMAIAPGHCTVNEDVYLLHNIEDQ
jgi:hypothetical protein